jgi:hypothetical protein
MVGGSRHEHIAEVKWTNATKSDRSSREEMVRYLRAPGNRAQVTAGGKTAEVGVVNASPPYIQTHADGVWTDNLLALPRY